jgi:hypothetical protein
MAFRHPLAILLCLPLVPCARAQKAKPIEKEEIAEWTNRMEECPLINHRIS